MKKPYLISLLLVLLINISFADVIHMKNGRKLEGKIVSETDEAVTVKLKHGTVEIFRSQIKEIEKKLLPEETYLEKSRALSEEDSEGHYLLALWCKEQGLDSEYMKELEKTIKIDPDHAAARKLLGFERKGDDWIKIKPETPDIKPDAANAAGVIREFFSSDPRKFKEFLERLGDYDGMSKGDFRNCSDAIRKWRKYGVQPAGWQETKSGTSGMSGDLWIPEGYDGTKPFPVLIFLHGSTETSKDIINAWRATEAWSKIKDELILVAPRSKDSRWWRKEIISKLDLLVNELKNSFNVDTNRIYLSGYSNGAHGSWYYGLRRADTFAAIAPDSGLPLSSDAGKIDFDSLKNALNLPVFVINGEKDSVAPGTRVEKVVNALRKLGRRDIVHKQFPGGHRAHAADAWTALYEWFTRQSRNPFPASVKLFFNSDCSTHSYWLELVDPENGAAAKAQIKDNIINISVSGASEVIIYLSDEILDLDKKITIRLNNRRVFEDKVKRSASAALGLCLARNDRNFIYSASLRFKIEQ